MQIPRIAAIHDLSGFGRCSLSVILPLLSAMNTQACPIPTAFLSTHTGGFSDFTFFDLTGEMLKTALHWHNLKLDFTAVYSGFLASERQIGIVCDIIDTLKKDNTVILVDPVMGDNGIAYKTYTPQMCRKMSELTAKADIITPNLTEAALLLDLPFETCPQSCEAAEIWLNKLSSNGVRSVALTGLSIDSYTIGVASFDRDSQKTDFYFTRRIDCDYPGTGDIFASVLLGAILNGVSFQSAVRKAADFVHDCAEFTLSLGTQPRFGVQFESLIHKLIQTPPQAF